jgi:sugar O-acyltransferase (sialic acid O-acetyltransferase NeuD family)
MRDVVVVGASGHAEVVIDILERQGIYRIAGLIDRSVKGHLMGYEILGTESDLPGIVREREIAGGIVAIGDNWTRHRVVNALNVLLPGFAFVTAVHPSAQIGRNATVGRGSAVMAGAVINPNARVGEFCVVNTNASLDHGSVMGDFSGLLPNAVTGGNVLIGAFAAVCQGANIIHGVEIGEHTVIGAGATVFEDMPPRVVAYGTPARVIRSREPGEPYLNSPARMFHHDRSEAR